MTIQRAPFMPVVAVLAIGSVGVALVSQHVFDMQPCAWCTFQRLIYLLIGAVALLATVRQVSGRGQRRRVSALALVSVVLALAGLVSALYQHFVAARSDSCALTFADKVIKGLSLDTWAPWLFKATAFCHEANIDLWRVPYALWSALLFALLLFLSLRASWRPSR